MIYLNLLPPTEKELIKINQANQLIILIGAYLLSVLLFFSLLLTVQFLVINFKALDAANNLKETQKKLIFEGFESIQGRLESVNTKIKNIRQIQQNYRHYSLGLTKIISILPDGAQITSVSADQHQFNIKGFAPSRDLVVALKTTLEQSPYFADIDSPITNFLQAENINFSFSFKLKNEAFTL